MYCACLHLPSIGVDINIMHNIAEFDLSLVFLIARIDNGVINLANTIMLGSYIVSVLNHLKNSVILLFCTQR